MGDGKDDKRRTGIVKTFKTDRNNRQDKEIMKMIGYKGFDKDLKCRDFQYEVGKEYEHDGKVKLCESGFHFCENPHGVFGHYSPGKGNRFAIVEADGVSDEREGDSKRVAKKLKIKSEISVFEMCRIAVDVFFEDFGFKKKIESAEGNSAGDGGAARAGYNGAASAGDNGAARAGHRGAASAGHRGAARAGDFGAARAGDFGAARAGYNGAASAGDFGAARAGDNGAAEAGRLGVAAVGNSGRVKGRKGSVLVARDIKYNNNRQEYEVADWACALVDGKKIKEDTWYVLKDGKLVEEEK